MIFRFRRHAVLWLTALALIGACVPPAIAEAQGLAATIRFPPRLLSAPLRLTVRITNHTGRPVRIGTNLSVRPEVLDAAGRIVPFEGGTNMARIPRPLDFEVAAPGASVIIPVTGVLRLSATGLEWRGGDGLAGIWQLTPSAGPWRLRFRYKAFAADAAGPLPPPEVWPGEAVTGSSVALGLPAARSR